MVCFSCRSRYARGRMCANASIVRMGDSFDEQSLVWLQVASAAEVAEGNRVRSPRVSPSHVELQGMDTMFPGFARGMFAPRTAVATRATGGPSTRLPAASGPGRRLAGASARRAGRGGVLDGGTREVRG